MQLLLLLTAVLIMLSDAQAGISVRIHVEKIFVETLVQAIQLHYVNTASQKRNEIDAIFDAGRR